MSANRKLVHRLKEARERAGLSWKSVSRRTGLSIGTIRQHEQTNEITLSELLLWREALGVPMAELFGDPPEKLADVHRFRAGLMQIMRGVRSLLSTELSDAQSAFVRNIESKLQTLMPELETTRAWPIYGNRRNAPSRIESQVIATSVWLPDIHNEV